MATPSRTCYPLPESPPIKIFWSYINIGIFDQEAQASPHLHMNHHAGKKKLLSSSFVNAHIFVLLESVFVYNSWAINVENLRLDVIFSSLPISILPPHNPMEGSYSPFHFWSILYLSTRLHATLYILINSLILNTPRFLRLWILPFLPMYMLFHLLISYPIRFLRFTLQNHL